MIDDALSVSLARRGRRDEPLADDRDRDRERETERERERERERGWVAY